MLPFTAACDICNLDGWGQELESTVGKPVPTAPSSLFKCTVCFSIVHPACIGINPHTVTVRKEKPNSWECPHCCGKKNSLNSSPHKLKTSTDSLNLPINSENAINASTNEQPSTSKEWAAELAAERKERLALRIPLAVKIIMSSKRTFVQPHVVVRPAPLPPIQSPGQDTEGGSLVYNQTVIVAIFRFLNMKELVTCALVCRTWARYSIDPSLWKKLDVSHCHLTTFHLTGIVRRQPERLFLDWTNVTKQQLAWLFPRIPLLRTLSLQGCTWSGVSALRSSTCPPLTTLNLSYVSGLNDSTLREILTVPIALQSDLTDDTSRLRDLKNLFLAGCEISDLALRYITLYLSHLETLDVSSCRTISDLGVAYLTIAPAQTVTNLTSLNLANCKLLTEMSLFHLERCRALKRLDLRHTSQVSAQAVAIFAARSMHNLYVKDVKLVQEKKKKRSYELRQISGASDEQNLTESSLITTSDSDNQSSNQSV